MLFTFPSRYFSSIGHQVVFRLGGWAPQLPTGLLVSRGTLDPAILTVLFVYMALTSYGRPSHAVPLKTVSHMPSVTPEILLPPVWPPPRSLATTCGISVDVFSSPYLDVSVQAVPLIYLCVQYMIPCGGFPHSDISGSLLICSSPKLFAAYRVLHRLLMPRHSPCALLRLTFRSTFLKSPLGSLLWLNYAGSSRKFVSFS